VVVLFRKGVPGAVYRAALLPVRYGISPDRVVSRLARMTALMSRWGTQPTVPVTASVLERHPDLLRGLRDADLAIHGYRHVSYVDMSLDEKRSDLESACGVFAKHGLVARGFRAPYLRADRETFSLLRDRGFLFDSSNTRFVLPASHSVSPAARDLAGSRYGMASRSRSADMLPTPIDMPVSMPDDEILIDGLGIRTTRGLSNVFDAMMESVSSAGSHLVLQIHPERFHICEAALERLVETATDAGAWLTSLSDAANWFLHSAAGTGRWPEGHSFALSVTGDLDAVALQDFARRSLGR